MTSLRHKLWLGFGSLLLILLAVSVLSVIVLTLYSHSLQRVFRENYDSAVYCDGMRESLDQLNIRAQRLIWEESAARQIDVAGLKSQFDSNLASQLGNITLPHEKEETDRLADLWPQYKLHYDQFDSAAAERPDLYREDLLPRYQEIKSVAGLIADMNMRNMVSVDGQVRRTLVEVRSALVVLAVAGTLLAGIVVWAAGTRILKPLRELTNSARQIESGNLDLNLPIAARDEIGQLAEAFNSMTSRLREFRRLDHDRLARSRQTTQLAIDSLPDAVFVIGPGGVIEISNRAAQAYFGIEPGKAAAELGLKWLTPLYEQVKEHGQAVEPQAYTAAIQLFEKGQERFLLPRAVPMLDATRRQIGVTVILVDITLLRHADEMKSGVVSTVSHELRTPLTSLRMALSLLMDSAAPLLSARQNQLLAVAKQDSDRLYRIIENLLNISRIESGRAQFQFRSLSVKEIVASAVDPLRQSFIYKNLRLEAVIGPDTPNVQADPVLIGSALTNLLSNALKFTPAGGEVIVTAESAGEFVAFSVADTGPGIAGEFRPRIFEKFFRVPTPSGPTGAGLGLSITKEIVETHGGHIEFVPQTSGQGTIFRFFIPKSPIDEKSARAIAEPSLRT